METQTMINAGLGLMAFMGCWILRNLQGPSIPALVLAGAQTDYFEIFVRQDSGGNRDITGPQTDTFAMFLMQS